MDKNRELHELLGLKWFTPEICPNCGYYCTGVTKFCPPPISNPDYAADSRLVLREMKKRDDWIDFQQWCFVGVTELDGDVCYGVPIDLALGTTGELRDLAIEYLRSK